MRIQVTRKTWKFGDAPEEVQAIKIRTPFNYLHIPMAQSRVLCDELHDLADEHDREQREAANNVN